MQEFRIESDAARHDALFRVVSWGTVVVLSELAVLFLVLHVSELLFIFCTLGAVIGASILVCREALHYASRKMVFLLDGDEIIRKRQGFPDVKISFSEMTSLSEGRGWLVVKCTAQRKIAIPKGVKGYEAILHELAGHCPLSAQAELPLKSIAVLAIALLSWTAFLRANDLRVAIPAGGIALIVLAFASRRLLKLWSKSQGFLNQVSLVFAWLLALLLIYLRLMRP